MRIPKSNRKKATDELHKAFKEYAGIDTISDLSTKEMEAYMSMIRVLMARERGMFIHEPNEPDDIASWDMHRFLQYKLYNKTI